MSDIDGMNGPGVYVHKKHGWLILLTQGENGPGHFIVESGDQEIPREALMDFSYFDEFSGWAWLGDLEPPMVRREFSQWVMHANTIPPYTVTQGLYEFGGPCGTPVRRCGPSIFLNERDEVVE